MLLLRVACAVAAGEGQAQRRLPGPWRRRSRLEPLLWGRSRLPPPSRLDEAGEGARRPPRRGRGKLADEHGRKEPLRAAVAAAGAVADAAAAHCPSPLSRRRRPLGAGRGSGSKLRSAQNTETTRTPHISSPLGARWGQKRCRRRCRRAALRVPLCRRPRHRHHCPCLPGVADPLHPRLSLPRC